MSQSSFTKGSKVNICSCKYGNKQTFALASNKQTNLLEITDTKTILNRWMANKENLSEQTLHGKKTEVLQKH